MRPEFEVRLLHNLQLVAGLQAIWSFSDTGYEVKKSSTDPTLFYRNYGDNGANFLFYDIHAGLSYLLVK